MIRSATTADLQAITDIHNQAIAARFQTAFMTQGTVEDKAKWFATSSASYPVFVYEHRGIVAGYFYISSYRGGREALRTTAEISYFLHKSYQGKGIGSQLLAYAIALCRELGYKTMLAIVMEPNIASVKLLQKFDFQLWGRLPDVGDYDGVICSQVYYGLKL